MKSQQSTDHALRTIPKVSVLVPNRNYAQFLPESLESILQQEFTDFELIVSDDASADDSAEIISGFARRDARIRFTRQPENLGLVGNFNWCLAQARGQYVKFLLADDKLIRKDALGRLVAMLDQDSDVVLASCSAQIINERSEYQGVRDYLGRNLLEPGTVTCRRCLLSGTNQIGEPSLFIFRRRCVGTGFNPRYRLWLDLEFAIHVLEQGRFAYCAEPLVGFRRHAVQQSQILEKSYLVPEFYGLLRDFAERPWLGPKLARERLFEDLYQLRKHARASADQSTAIDLALEHLGRDGYTKFLIRRKLLRPFQNLRRSVTKRLAGGGVPAA